MSERKEETEQERKKRQSGERESGRNKKNFDIFIERKKERK